MTTPQGRKRQWDLNDLVGISEIAEIFGRTRGAVCNWRNRYDEFPDALIELYAGPIFSRKEVLAWHRAQFPAFRKD
jgi:hypothetical protein